MPVTTDAPRFRDMADWSRTTPAELWQAHMARNPHTARGYAADWGALAEWLKVPDAVAAVRTMLDAGRPSCKRRMLAWLNAMNGAALAAKTICRRAAAVTSLIALAQDLEVIAWTLGKLPLPPPVRVREVEGPSREVIGEMMSAADLRGDAKGTRDRCIVALLYWEALRAAETLSIRSQDVDEERGTVRIIGKRGRGRQSLRLCQLATEAVRAWIERRGREPGALFTTCPQGATQFKKPLTYSGLWNAVRWMGAAAGAKVWPHALRHSAITHLAERTNDSPAWGCALSRHGDVRAWSAYQDRKVSHVSAAEVLSRGTYVRTRHADNEHCL